MQVRGSPRRCDRPGHGSGTAGEQTKLKRECGNRITIPTAFSSEGSAIYPSRNGSFKSFGRASSQGPEVNMYSEESEPQGICSSTSIPRGFSRECLYSNYENDNDSKPSVPRTLGQQRKMMSGKVLSTYIPEEYEPNSIGQLHVSRPFRFGGLNATSTELTRDGSELQGQSLRRENLSVGQPFGDQEENHKSSMGNRNPCERISKPSKNRGPINQSLLANGYHEHRRLHFHSINSVETTPLHDDFTTAYQRLMRGRTPLDEENLLSKLISLDFGRLCFPVPPSKREELNSWLIDVSTLVVLHKFRSPYLYVEYVLDHTLSLLNLKVNEEPPGTSIGSDNSFDCDDVMADSVFGQLCLELLRHLTVKQFTERASALTASLALMDIIRKLMFRSYLTSNDDQVTCKKKNASFPQFSTIVWNGESYRSLWMKDQKRIGIMQQEMEQNTESSLRTKNAYDRRLRGKIRRIWRLAARTAVLAKRRRDLYFSRVLAPSRHWYELICQLPERRAQTLLLKIAANMRGGVNAACVMKLMLLLSPEQREVLFTGISAWIRLGDSAFRKALFYSKDTNLRFTVKAEERTESNQFATHDVYSGDRTELLQEHLSEFIEQNTLATNLKFLLQASQGLVQNVSEAYETSLSDQSLLGFKSSIASQFAYMLEIEYYNHKRRQKHDQKERKLLAESRDALVEHFKHTLDCITCSEAVGDEWAYHDRDDAHSMHSSTTDGDLPNDETMDQEETRREIFDNDRDSRTAPLIVENRLLLEEARPLFEDARTLSGYSSLVLNISKALGGDSNESQPGISIDELMECLEEPAICTSRLVREIQSLKYRCYDVESKFEESTQKMKGLERRVNVLRWKLSSCKGTLIDQENNWTNIWIRKSQILSAMSSENKRGAHCWSWTIPGTRIVGPTKHNQYHTHLDTIPVQRHLRCFVGFNPGIKAVERSIHYVTETPSVTLSWNPLLLAQAGISVSDAYMLGSDFVQTLLLTSMRNCRHLGRLFTRLLNASTPTPDIPHSIRQTVESFAESQPMSQDDHRKMYDACIQCLKHWLVLAQRSCCQATGNLISPVLYSASTHLASSLLAAMNVDHDSALARTCAASHFTLLEKVWCFLLESMSKKGVADKSTETAIESTSDDGQLGSFSFSTYIEGPENQITEDVPVSEIQPNNIKSDPALELHKPEVSVRPCDDGDVNTETTDQEPFLLPLFLPTTALHVTYSVDEKVYKCFRSISKGEFPLLNVNERVERHESEETCAAKGTEGNHAKQRRPSLSSDSVDPSVKGAPLTFTYDGSSAYNHPFRADDDSHFCTQGMAVYEIISNSVNDLQSGEGCQMENPVYFLLKNEANIAYYRMQRCHLLQQWASTCYAKTIAGYFCRIPCNSCCQQKSQENCVCHGWSWSKGNWQFGLDSTGTSSEMETIIRLLSEHSSESVLQTLTHGKLYCSEKANSFLGGKMPCGIPEMYCKAPKMTEISVIIQERSITVQECEDARQNTSCVGDEIDRSVSVNLRQFLRERRTFTIPLALLRESASSGILFHRANQTLGLHLAPWGLHATHVVIKDLLQWLLDNRVLDNSISPDTLKCPEINTIGEEYESGYDTVMVHLSKKFFREQLSHPSSTSHSSIGTYTCEKRWIHSFRNSVEIYSLISSRSRVFGTLCGWVDSLSEHTSRSKFDHGVQYIRRPSQSFPCDEDSTVNSQSECIGSQHSSSSDTDSGTSARVFRKAKQLPTVNSISEQLDAIDVVLSTYKHLISSNGSGLMIGTGNHAFLPPWRELSDDIAEEEVTIPGTMDFSRTRNDIEPSREQIIRLIDKNHAMKVVDAILIERSLISIEDLRHHCSLHHSLQVLQSTAGLKRLKLGKFSDNGPRQSKHVSSKDNIKLPEINESSSHDTGKRQINSAKVRVNIPKKLIHCDAAVKVEEQLSRADVIMGLAMRYCCFMLERYGNEICSVSSKMFPTAPSISVYEQNLPLLKERSQWLVRENVLPRISDMAFMQTMQTHDVSDTDLQRQHDLALKVDVDAVAEISLLGWQLTRIGVYDHSLKLPAIESPT